MSQPPTSHSESAHLKGPPASPLQKRTRGVAFAMAALVGHAVTGKPRRLHWCVDMQRDLGLEKVATSEMTNGNRDDALGRVLERFKGALDSQAWGPYHCTLAMTARHYVWTSAGQQQVVITFNLPYFVDMTCVAVSTPSAGCWRLAEEPPTLNSRSGAPHDNLPHEFWSAGIPF